jgi:hypothetical protein
MLLRALSLNTRHGGVLTPEGAADGRWSPMADLIRECGAHLVCLQETQSWTAHNRQQACRAEASTGLRMLWPTINGRSQSLMYDPDVMRLLQWEDHYTSGQREPGWPGIAVFDIGTRIPLATTSVHLAPYSSDRGRAQASLLAWRARRYGDLALVMGDFNHLPTPHRLDPPLPDPESLPAANIAGRWDTDADGYLVPDRSVAHLLARARYTDTAQLVADRTGNPALLAPTGHGGGVRVDWALVTEPIVPAVVDHQALTVSGSDHDAVLVTVDTDLIDPSLTITPNR